MRRAGRGLTVSLAIRTATLLAALASLLAPGPAALAQPAPEPRPDARAWVLVDAGDREVLAARAPRRQASIASTTKLMTAYVARRELSLDEVVVAPAYDAAPVESLLGLRAGERIEVRDLLAGLLLPSGNDAAIALAEAAAGSVSDFVAEMNRGARMLGLADTSFANPIGLDQEGNHSTPRDLADLAIAVRRDRFLRRLVGTPRIGLRSGIPREPVVNRNPLVHRHPWINGVKTGNTLGAGNVLVGSGSQRGVTLVSVVLGAPSEAARDAGTLELLRYGFSLYDRETVVEAGEALAEPEVRYRRDSLRLIAARALALTLREGEEVETRVSTPPEVEGPISRGEPIGRVRVRVDGEPAGSVPLRAARAVPAATAVERVDAAVPGPRGVVWAVGLSGVALVLGGIFVAAEWRRGRRTDSLSQGEEGP